MASGIYAVYILVYFMFLNDQIDFYNVFSFFINNDELFANFGYAGQTEAGVYIKLTGLYFI